MNAAILIILGILWFIFAYFWYGKIIQKKVVFSNDGNITPSEEINDGKDYVPTNPIILFGHHFSSIAGAGPIVGPIFAFSLFGWVPVLIWILLGSVFIGAVHDYAALIASLRHKGVSIVEYAESVISKRARLLFSIFVWSTLVLVEAVFADLTAKTLAEKPEIALPTFGLIAIASVFGVMVYKYKINFWISTLAGIASIFLLIIASDYYPISASYEFWLNATFIYCLIASLLPVWALLQPRDYLSMYILIIGLTAGFIGIILCAPEIKAPAFIEFNSPSGPLFPILFITIACGAVSGFHSLVSSGTTSKQLAKESDGKRIAFGGMLTEGALALLVITMIAGVIPYNGMGEFTFNNLFSKSVNIVFGTALGLSLESLSIPLVYGTAFGVLMINAFLLTSLDTCARLNRYIIEETLGARYGGLFKNKFIAVILGLTPAYFLCLYGGYKIIWPVFGASNQLIATLALFVITVYFIGYKAKKLFTLIPAIFMLIVSESALFYQMIWVYPQKNNWLLSGISCALFLLGVFVAFESLKKIFQLKRKNAAL